MRLIYSDRNYFVLEHDNHIMRIAKCCLVDQKEEQVIGAYLDDLNERNVIKRKSLYGQFVLNWFEELIRGIQV